MLKSKLFFHLTCTGMKRLKNYIPHILISVAIILSICGSVGVLISKYIYREESLTRVNIAYYLPDDEDLASNSFGLNIIKDMDGTKEIINLIQVNTIDEGYNLLEKGDVLYYIIVPENFFSGIMDSTNPELTILFRDNSHITAYISNELFCSYARYLCIAQSGVYSAINTMRNHDITTMERQAVQRLVNMTYLDRSLNKDSYIIKEEATTVGSHSLKEHYLASAVMLTLFFISFVMFPCLQGYNKGVKTKLRSYNVTSFHIFLSNFIITIPALYIAYIPCFLIIAFLSGNIYLPGLLLIIPALILISLIINMVSSICSNQFTSDMAILTLTLIIAYAGGGILPNAMLPDAIKSFSSFLPGEYILTNIANSLFGL